MGVHWCAPPGISVPPHRIFFHAISDDISNDFVNSIFFVVRLWRLSTLSQRSVLQNVLILNIHMMTLVEARFSCDMVNINYIFMSFSSNVRVQSRTVTISHGFDSRSITFF